MRRWACIVKAEVGFTVAFGVGTQRLTRQFHCREDAESYARDYILWG